MGGETQTCAKRPNRSPFRGSRPRYVPGGSFHLGAAQANGGDAIERRCCLGSVAFVISLPALTSRADERNVGDEIGRGATSIAAPLRRSPADVAGQAAQDRRPRIMPEKSPLLRRRHCYFPGGGGSKRGKNPSRTKSPHEAPVWRIRPSFFSGGCDHVCGRQANNSRETGPGVTLAARPRLTSRETWPPGRKRRQRARNTRT